MVLLIFRKTMFLCQAHNLCISDICKFQQKFLMYLWAGIYGGWEVGVYSTFRLYINLSTGPIYCTLSKFCALCIFYYSCKNIYPEPSISWILEHHRRRQPSLNKYLVYFVVISALKCTEVSQFIVHTYHWQLFFPWCSLEEGRELATLV